MPKTTLYCTKCGHKLEPRRTGEFSPTTGHPVMESVCMNGHCTVGCMNVYGKHDFPFFRKKCRRCQAYKVIDYDSYYYRM